MSRSSSSSTGWTVRTTKGSVTNSSATTTLALVYARLRCSGLVAPYRARSTRPATIVGSANGRSISVSTMDCPGNLSRVSTQAMTVPMTTLMAATSSEARTVSLSAAHESGVVTARQKTSGPPRVPRQTTAASGTRTIRLRYSTAVPRPRPVPTGGLRRYRGGGGETRTGPDVSTSGPASVAAAVVTGYFELLGVGLATVATPS